MTQLHETFKDDFLVGRYTKKKAVELGIRGWCKNTEEKTVTGQLEGPRQQLSHIGSENGP
ncbi:Acylphosphatase-2 [Portunus trituberculatus]|uniref:acylphosphatase n=1 Tax=Portunus trituberculatus TaxID=210409 RepID=A0A5B7EP54_PORTR|nr:Acylphosphatase-2 [Portunus trituberculatus]